VQGRKILNRPRTFHVLVPWAPIFFSGQATALIRNTGPPSGFLWCDGPFPLFPLVSPTEGKEVFGKSNNWPPRESTQGRKNICLLMSCASREFRPPSHFFERPGVALGFRPWGSAVGGGGGGGGGGCPAPVPVFHEKRWP